MKTSEEWKRSVGEIEKSSDEIALANPCKEKSGLVEVVVRGGRYHVCNVREDRESEETPTWIHGWAERKVDCSLKIAIVGKMLKVKKDEEGA